MGEAFRIFRKRGKLKRYNLRKQWIFIKLYRIYTILFI